jgi:hypothetical protein
MKKLYVKILQNAIEYNDVIFMSTHRHDLVLVDQSKGYFIDGGYDYFCSFMPHYGDYKYLRIVSSTPIRDRVEKSVWGKLIDGKRVWTLLKDCSSDHLQNILPLLPDDDWKIEVIQYILSSRPKKRVLDQIRNRLLSQVCADLS